MTWRTTARRRFNPLDYQVDGGRQQCEANRTAAIGACGALVRGTSTTGRGFKAARNRRPLTLPHPAPPLQVVPNFRIGTIPVLGTTPAIFGLACAAYILCQLAGQPFAPEPHFRVQVCAGMLSGCWRWLGGG